MKIVVYFLVLVPFILFSNCNQQNKQAKAFYEGGNTQVKSGNIINAIIYYNKSIALDSTQVEVFMARANAKLSVVDYKGAIGDFTKVIQMDPKRAEAYLSRGVVKVYMKEFTNEAASDLMKAIQLNPKLTNAYYNLGVIKYVQHDLETACVNWKKAAEMGSAQAIAKVNTYCK
jgi:tetratricopeptide (TPR) repeat protein